MNRLWLWMAGLLLAGARAAAADDPVLADFEGKDYGNWPVEGTAFGAGPTLVSQPHRLKVSGQSGQGWADSFSGGEAATGRLSSPEFKLERPFINFKIWGGRDVPERLGVELLVDGQVVRAASATEGFDPTHTLYARTWAVADLAGRTARIRVNDQSAGGALAVDQFVQSASPATSPTDSSVRFQETFRPQFHFTAESGWLNDVNGLLQYHGTWHLFHQHKPPGSPFVQWGHATSADLLHWQHQPAAIPSDDNAAIFSGSGWVDAANASGLQQGAELPLLLFYTRHPTAVSGEKATQCLAYSTDGGRTFTKYAGNPLLRTPDYNDRDPKVFFHEPSRAWFMVLSLSQNNTNREQACYGLFRSRDLKAWELIQKIGPGGWYWECPDFFEIPLEGAGGQTKWILSKGSGDYLVGTFDGTAFKPEAGPIRIQWGGSYYGAQTFSTAPGGRRIQIAWMNSGPKTQISNDYPGMPFNQQLSFPRELTLRTTPEGPRLFRQPVAEIAQLYAQTHAFPPQPLPPGRNPLAEIHADLLDIELEVELQQARQLVLELRGARIGYDVASAKLTMGGRVLALAPEDGCVQLRILLDRTSIELFAAHGAVTHSNVFFPDPANRTIVLTAVGGAAQIRKLVVHELQSIWKGR